MPRSFWLLPGLMLLAMATVIAQEQGKTWAVVIGVGNYEEYEKLDYAMEDAKGVYKFLLAPQGGGLQEEQVKYLENPKAVDIDDTVEWLKNQAQEHDRIFLYFSGHGDQEEVDGKIVTYLIAADSRKKKLARTAVELAQYVGKIERLPVYQVATVLDCCHSGAAAQRKDSKDKGKPKAIKQDIVWTRPTENRLRITACRTDELALELKQYKQSAFTFYLLQALEGAGDNDGDSQIDLVEAYTYLAKLVQAEAKKRGGQQTPDKHGALSTPFYLKVKANDRAMELLIEEPTELKQGNRAETALDEIELTGFVRYGVGVASVQVSGTQLNNLPAKLTDMGQNSVYFKVKIPLPVVGRNTIMIVATDKIGKTERRVITVERRPDPIVKLEIIPGQVTCKPGETVVFQSRVITQNGHEKEIALEWKAQNGRIDEGNYTAPRSNKEDVVTICDLPERKLAATAQVKIVKPAKQSPEPEPDVVKTPTEGSTVAGPVKRSPMWVETSTDGRYTRSSAGIIMDTKTKLEWYVGPDEDTNWDKAKAWADSLTIEGSGWRLPSKEELKGLLTRNKLSSWKSCSLYIDPIFNMTGTWVWTSARLYASEAWFVDFLYGQAYSCDRGKVEDRRAFAVRSVIKY